MKKNSYLTVESLHPEMRAVMLPLFDPQPVAPPRVESAPRFADAGVRRVIEHKAGPFRELGEGGIPNGREFRMLEMEDGRVLWQYIDNGEQRPATNATTRILIDDMLTARVWREVSA